MMLPGDEWGYEDLVISPTGADMVKFHNQKTILLLTYAGHPHPVEMSVLRYVKNGECVELGCYNAMFGFSGGSWHFTRDLRIVAIIPPPEPLAPPPPPKRKKRGPIPGSYDPKGG